MLVQKVPKVYNKRNPLIAKLGFLISSYRQKCFETH